MPINLNVLKVLKTAGYTELNPDTPTDGRLAHLVYLIKNDNGDIESYSQSTRAVRHALGKFKSFLRYGRSKYLPLPVQHAVTFSYCQFPELSIKVFYKKGTIINHELETKLTKWVKPITCKERDFGNNRNVYKVSVKGDKRFKLISSKTDANKVVSKFITKSRDMADATYQSTAIAYKNWAVLNYGKLNRDNIEITVLGEGFLNGEDKTFIKLYLAESDPDCILNKHGA